MEERKRARRKIREGTVVGISGNKTIVVLLERRVRHPLYGKEIHISRKIHVHDEENRASIGAMVRVMETRPISRLKRWRLVSILTEAAK